MYYYHVVIDTVENRPGNVIDTFLVVNKNKIKAKKLAIQIATKIKQSIGYITSDEYIKSEYGNGDRLDVTIITDVINSVGNIRIYYHGITNTLPQLLVVKSVNELSIIDDINNKRIEHPMVIK